MQLRCHSSASFHDYRLRGGAGGAFSLSATRTNYSLTLAQLAMESDDPRASRLVRKNLFRPEVSATGYGIAHRGGPLFEDFKSLPAVPASCDGQSYDYDAGTSATPTGKTPHVVIDNMKGSVRISGAAANEVKVVGRKNVRAIDRARPHCADGHRLEPVDRVRHGCLPAPRRSSCPLPQGGAGFGRIR